MSFKTFLQGPGVQEDPFEGEPRQQAISLPPEYAQYEYVTISDQSHIEKHLNRYGKEGYRLIAIAPSPGSDYRTLIMERRIK